MTTTIWIEPVKRTSRGLLLRARLGGPEGDILCDGVPNAICESARALMARGITGPFETRKAGIAYAFMRGDIETTAGLTVREPDRGLVHFAVWTPFNLDAHSRSPVPAPASDSTAAGTPAPVMEIA